MSFEKNQCKQASNKIIENEDNNNKEKENNILLRPIAIKQNILTNNQPNNNININKYQNVSTLYQNQPTPQYLKGINSIKSKNNENIKCNSNDMINNNEKGAFSLITNSNNNVNNINNTNNNNNNSNNNNYNKINYLKNERMEQNNKIHCTCKKTKCIKKYCECYSNGVFCYNCKCENCENKPFYMDNNIKNSNNINININKKEEEEINENKNTKQSIDNNMDNNDNNIKKLIICTCSKSGCNKNYCECFKAKVKCNNKCRCIKCLNKPEDSIQLDETKMISKSISTPINNNNILNNSVNTNNANNFTVHRISVNINKVQTLINTEKLDYFDSNKFLCKKRTES